jgi:hypothetical protein
MSNSNWDAEAKYNNDLWTLTDHVEPAVGSTILLTLRE